MSFDVIFPKIIKQAISGDGDDVKIRKTQNAINKISEKILKKKNGKRARLVGKVCTYP